MVTQVDEIRQSIEIDAPIERVWKLVSEPGWWINDGELQEHEVSLSAQPDGTLVAEVRGHGAGVWRLVVVELIENEYAAFRWAPHAAAGRDATGPTGSTLVEFTLRPASGRVVVEVVESGFCALAITPDRIAANHADNTEGWGQELALLAKLAA
ncbi:SRPBCC domain-containing protein [Gryllotalpicola koreensis]|uniref:SRPBCC family protein n=1 Tax=Gryllotalpicola koreensis TaxID=993086 RepID=A0ABP7ZY73_9MICO